MKNQIRLYLFNHRTWVYNLQYIGISILLLIIVTFIDYSTAQWSRNLPQILFTKLDLSKTVLSSIAASLLSIAIFTFSSILSVLTYYSGSITPRAMENFVGKKITMKVLGIFMGGFIYCIASLNFMRSYDETRYVIAGTVGVVYALICVVYMVIFIQQTIRDLQPGNVIADAFEEALEIVKNEVKERDYDNLYENFDRTDFIPIYSSTSGYLEHFDFGAAKSTFQDFEGTFVLTRKNGEFIVKEQEIGRLYLNQNKNQEELEEKIEKIKKLYQIQDTKIVLTNYRYSIEKITEMTLMALSTGINDPTTAVTSIRRLGILLGELASVDTHHHIMHLDKGCIYYTSNTLEEDLYHTIIPIVNSGSHSPQVISALFHGFNVMALKSTRKNLSLLRKMAKEIYESTVPNFLLEIDRIKVREHYEAFEAFAAEKEAQK